MKYSRAMQLGGLLFLVSSACHVCGDTILLSTGTALDGTAVRTNGEDMLIVTDCAAFNFSRTTIKDIQADHAEAAEPQNTNRIAPFKVVVTKLASQPWASDLRPIPATVIDRGILRYVPYTSFRCGEDYEVNIYGDPQHPAGFEVGLYRKLLSDNDAKTNCINFAAALLGKVDDKELVHGLDEAKDLKNQDGLTFEITPPSAEDSYNGWWVSVYSERALASARASDDEIKRISIPKVEAQAEARTGDPTAWSAEDLKLARKTFPRTITFVNDAGLVVSNATVVRVNEGVSIVWREGASGGVLKLADLSPELREQFGYDPERSQTANQIEEANRRQSQAAQAVPAPVPQATVSEQSYDSLPYTSSGSSSRTYRSRSPSSGGSVYVHSYVRKDGTYVQSHTRSAPGSRRR